MINFVWEYINGKTSQQHDLANRCEWWPNDLQHVDTSLLLSALSFLCGVLT